MVSTIVSFILHLYLNRRLKKVFEIRQSMISFCHSIADYEKRSEWYAKEIPSFETMLYSFKPIRKFIIGTYAEEFINYIKNGND